MKKTDNEYGARSTFCLLPFFKCVILLDVHCPHDAQFGEHFRLNRSSFPL